MLIACATLMSAATVSAAGIVGWVGLVIPHVARMLFGMEPAHLLPATALLGALFLVGIDTLARSLFVVEVPIGVLTVVIGAPFFLCVLVRQRRGNWA